VQDMALLRMELPPIALHASTQCDTRVPEKARFLQDVGFSQIVLARELTLEEIRQVSDVVDVPLEVFVHGALCVSYSGDCQMSFVDNGRSANRGECAQMCRLSYDLADGNGKIVQSHRHLLSLRDMNRIEMLGSLAEAGVASFKIEGRLKDEAYVKNVTAAYSRALDKFIAANPEKYRRASQGRIEIDFTPALEKSFNRGFTDYFLNGPRPSGNMANIHTPKDAGTEIGEIKSRRGSGYEVVLRRGIELHNGDGLCFVNADGRLQGFRLNRVAGNCIYPAGNPGIFPGMKLRRNNDAAWEVAMRGKTSRRVIDCDARIWLTADRRLALRLSDDYGISATVTTDNVPELPSARNSDTSARRNAVGKLGDSIYMLRDFDDRISESVFVPSSLLSNLRRKCVELFDQSRLLSRRPDLRVNPVRDAEYKRTLTYHDNVANHLSHEFYASHGADVKQYALEAKSGLSQNELRVMTCRYCIRRELGVCLREGGEHKLHFRLY
ncbi:MAG: U32 family peptidase, partial [Muribaculaceae bacterium]|nr:U32 family peptidase [Muribaculaceae bacterium]